MAKYTKKEYAEQCGMVTRALASYINQKYVIVGEDGFIDTDDPVNFRMLVKRQNKLKKAPVPPSHTASPQYIPRTDSEDSEDEGLPTYEESERRVKYFDAIKREKEVEKLQIDIEKKRGEVIPSALMPPIIIQHNQSIITAFKNEFDDWLRNVSKKYNLSINDVADAKSASIDWMNTAMKKATQLSINSVANIVQEWSDKRGVGERL